MLNITAASQGDRQALVELERTIFDYDLISPRQMSYLLQSSSVVVCKAVYGVDIVGYMVVLTRKNSKVLRLYSIGVLSEVRELGIGRKLLSHAESLSTERGCNRVHLEVHAKNMPALHFYQRAGYSLYGQREHYYSDGAQALLLRKFIPSGVCHDPSRHRSPVYR